MANVPESPRWESGVYQFETTDPVQGGPDGIDNLPNKQLGNRTAYLKKELQAVRQSVEAVGVEGQNALWIAVEQAISFAGLLEKELHRQQVVRHQEGEFVLQNRGIIRGCKLSKSTTANRNIGLAAGAAFAFGREWGIAASDNAAAVPSNDTGTTATATAYLVNVGSGLVLSVTGLGGAPPDGAIALASLTIPADSNGTSDPSLDSVSITGTARTEPDWPWVQASPIYQQQALENVMGGDSYSLSLDVISFDGGQPPSLRVAAADRARNTFRAYLHGTADNVRCRYVAHLMNQ